MPEIINVGISPLYNAWLITGEKNILADGVPEEYSAEYTANIEKHIGDAKIDCIICNHASTERAGSLSALLDKNPDITVYSTVAGLRNIKEIINRDFNGEICKNGLVIFDDFEFCITPNVPWPDTMLTFMHSEKALFSAELFSKECEKHYRENLSHFPDFVKAASEKAEKFSPDAIYPSSGEVITNTREIFDIYKKLTLTPESIGKVIIPYVSKTGNTKKMAQSIKSSFESKGIAASLYNLENSDELSCATDELPICGAVVLGTYTYKRSMPGCVFDFLSAFDVNTVSGKPYFVFGSQGWSGEGTFMADSILSMLKMRRSCKTATCIFTPCDDDFKTAEKCVDAVIRSMKEERTDSANA